MCFCSRSGYRPFINPSPSLGNLLLDITLCSISFRCRFVFVVVNFRVSVRVRVWGLGLGIGFGFGIGNLKIFDGWRCRHSRRFRPLDACQISLSLSLSLSLSPYTKNRPNHSPVMRYHSDVLSSR